MPPTAEVALRGGGGTTEHRESLERIVSELQRSSQLVDNLLLIANADAGHGRPAMRSTNLAAAVGEACTEGAVLARAKGITLSAGIPEEPVLVEGDADALRRLFLILIDNAIKYTPTGGRCDVVVATRNGEATGTVRDDGIGIAAEDLPHIFDRFYRVDRARSRAQGGSGLGLAIGRWIAESHDGSIGVKSEPGRGSVFTVRIPLTDTGPV